MLAVGEETGAPGKQRPARRRRPGYVRTVLAGFVVLAASNAVGFYGLAVYLGGLESSGRFSLSVVSALTSVFFISSGVANLLVGRGLPVLGVRTMLLIGAAATGVGVWLVGHAVAPWQLFCAYVLLGAGMSLTGPIALTTALIRVAEDSPRRNQAMAAMLSGMTAGGAFFVPVLAGVVERYGLADATLVAAPLALVAIAVSALLVARAGAEPTVRAGRGDAEGGERSGPEEGLPKRRARLAFILLSASFTIFMGSQVGYNTQLYAIASEHGIPGAGGALGVAAGTGMAARIVGILLVRWVEPERFLAGMAFAQFLSPLALLTFPNQTGLYASAFLLGMAVGNGSVLSPILTLKISGRAGYARMLSRVSFLTTLGIAAGPMISGGIADFVGTYDVVLVGISVLTLLSAIGCLVLERVTSAGKKTATR